MLNTFLVIFGFLGIVLFAFYLKGRSTRDTISTINSSIDLSKFKVFDDLKISSTTQSKISRYIRQPVSCRLYINEDTILALPNPAISLFALTDLPLMLKMELDKARMGLKFNTWNSITLDVKSKNSGLSASDIEYLIEPVNEEQKHELMSMLEAWS